MYPSAMLIAMLLVHLVQRRNAETSRETTRVRITRESLKRICGRDSLQDRFIDRVLDALPAFGWVGFRTPDDDLALIELDRVRAWVAVSTKRLLRTPDEQGIDRAITVKLRQARRSDDPTERAALYDELEKLLRKAGVAILPEPDDDSDAEGESA